LYSVTKKTSYGHGAAMMVSRKVIETVGGMNESYFLYYEEIDWCQRIRKHGFEVYYIASSVVFHKESTSVKKQSPLKIYYLSRNRMLFAKLHCKSWQLFIYFVYNLFVLMPKSILKYIFKPVLLKAYLSGLASHLYAE
jgi:GT2 family glycosyltransferase